MTRIRYLIFSIMISGWATLGVQAQAVEFPVEHRHILRNRQGTLRITPECIQYNSTGPKDIKDSRTWQPLDVWKIQIVSPTELEISTYEDQKAAFGRDKIFHFRILKGEITPSLSRLLMATFSQAVVTSVFASTDETPVYRVPVKHLRRFSGTQGELEIYPDRLYYKTRTSSKDSRVWRYADIQDITQFNRSRLTLTTFENGFDSLGKVFSFQLRDEIAPEVYDYLWTRIFPVRRPGRK